MTTGEKIKALRKQYGFTQSELGEKLGVKKNAVSKWECGRVEDIPNSKVKAMSALFGVTTSYLMDDDITSSPFTIPGVLPLPNFVRKPRLGTIACGKPILAVEDAEEFDNVPDDIDCDFTLKCKGDSMINARIFDGDIVYIRKQDTVENGEIAAVLIDDEATLKRVHLFEDHIILSPENPTHKPFTYWGEDMNRVRILGKAIAFTSKVY